MAGKGGGAWKVAYADFVTAMMAFFLVMWITAQSDQVKHAVAEHFSESFGWAKPRGEHPPQLIEGVQRKAIPVAPPKKNISDGLRLKKQQLGDVTMTIYFPGNSTTLDDSGRENLLRLVPQLAGKLQKIEIRGHSRRRGTSGDEPWSICFARATATAEFLQTHGISSKRLRISLAADNEPLYDEGEELLLDRNGRVEVMLLNEFVDNKGS